MERLRAKLAKAVEVRSTAVDSDLHSDLVTIMEQNGPLVCHQIMISMLSIINVSDQYQPGSFQRIFWDQQERAGLPR